METEELDINAGKVILYFSASWCGPCKTFSPVFEKVVEELNLPYQKIDIEKNPELAAQYQIRAIPSVVVLEEGKVIRTNAGNTSESALRSFLS